MAGELYKYLSIKSAIYTGPRLDILPHSVMPISGGYNQTRIVYDGTNNQVITHAAASRIGVKITYAHLIEADAGKIFDLYMDPAKAFGQARTFEWASPPVWPVMGYIYICRFVASTIETLIKPVNREFSELQLQIEGYKTP